MLDLKNIGMQQVVSAQPQHREGVHPLKTRFVLGRGYWYRYGFRLMLKKRQPESQTKIQTLSRKSSYTSSPGFNINC